MNLINIYFKVFSVILRKSMCFRHLNTWGSRFSNWYQLYGIVINQNALLYLKMVLYVNNIICESIFKDIILAVFIQNDVKTKIYYFKYLPLNINCLIFIYYTIFKHRRALVINSNTSSMKLVISYVTNLQAL